MPNNFRGRPQRWRWGSGYVNAADFPSVDQVNAYPEPRAGSDFDMSPGGAEDAWITGDDEFLSGTIRYIPRDDALTPYRTVGWNGTSGVSALLKWARQKNTIKVHPDARNLVVSPTMSVDADSNGVVDDFTSTTAPGHTTAFARDATELAQKITVSAATAAGFTYVSQFARGVMPGEALTSSCDVKCASLIAGGRAFLNLNFHNAAGAYISGINGTRSTNSAGYTRLTASMTAPANAAVALAIVGFEAQATGDTGIVYAKNFAMRRDGSTVYLDNPSYDAILEEPMNGAPPLEPNLMRSLPFKLRAASGVAFDGF